MLTKMPKVGDVVIANDEAERDIHDITSGKEYTIESVNRGGTAFYVDDAGDDSSLSEDCFEYFTLKSEASSTAGPVGFIALDYTRREDGLTVVRLSVDDAGFATIERVVSDSSKQRKRTEIQSQINALQAELNAL